MACGVCHDSRCGECAAGDREDDAIDAREHMMRGVVIVEFWAMMAGALPYGWAWEESNSGPYTYDLSVWGFGASLPHPRRVECRWSENEAHDELPARAWAAEYAARPREL